jgi:FKBP12-rapamycin complex-associated protein
MQGVEARANPALPGSIPETGRPGTFKPRHRSSTTTGRGAKPEDQDAKEVQNQRALEVLERVKEKLTGRDFKKDEALSVDKQVDKLIHEATNLENLCQHYIGWCSFW